MEPLIPRPDPAPSTFPGPSPRPRVLERTTTARGELCLRRHGCHLEIISNGVFLMSTDGGRSEQVMVDEALGLKPDARHVVLGGLGVGYSLSRACAVASLDQVTVVEVEPLVATWHRRHFSPWVGRPLDDARVRLEIDDVGRWLRRSPPTVDVICLDVDNGPGWTVHAGNADIYEHDMLGLCQRRLAPGGVLAVWSAHRSPGFARRLAELFATVRTVRVPAERGEDDCIYLGVRAT